MSDARSSRRSWFLRAALIGAGLLGLGFAGFIALLLWAAEDAGPQRIERCVAPLTSPDFCDGLNSSWTECSWSFHAEGSADRALCRSLRKRGSTKHEPADFEDVDGFSRVDCARFGLPGDLRCYVGERIEHEAHHRYLQAYDESCRRAVMLRSCNEALRTY